MTRTAVMALTLAALSFSAAAAIAAEPLVNLGRLSIAEVYGSGSSGGRSLDNPIYGVPNLFDDGTNRVNNIAYTYWLADKSPHWIYVSFRHPVTIHRIEVEIGPHGRPTSFQSSRILIEPAGIHTTISVSDTAKGTMVWRPAAPIESVRAVRFDFESPGDRADEIRILGVAPPETDLTEGMPKLDQAYGRRLVAEAKRARQNRRDTLYAEIQNSIATLRDTRAERDRDPPGQQTAVAWLESNRAADRLINNLRTLREFMPNSEKAWFEHTNPFILEAQSHDYWVGYCEPTGTWGATAKGYVRYLKIWPDGPDADEAAWFGALGNGPRCGDFEASIGEWETMVENYSAFIAQYPESHFAEEAAGVLVRARDGLEEAKQHRRSREDKLYAEIRSEIAAIREAAPELDREPPGQQTAIAWLESNRAADRLAKKLWKLQKFVSEGWMEQAGSIADEANSGREWVIFCDTTGYWCGRSLGYRRYLEIWPEGPDANEAAWFSLPRNVKFTWTVEEYENLVQHYGSFLSRYPESRFAEEARNRFDSYNSGLEKAKQLKAKRQ